MTAAAGRSAATERPVVASYCATFLKPEMLHIYRQITALERVRPVVIARKREDEERFPFEPLHVIAKPATHFLRQIWAKEIRRAPWQMSGGEVRRVRRVLDEEQAQLLHVYFGHIAVHLLPLIRAIAKPTIVSFHGADVMVDMEKPAYRVATKAMLAAVAMVLVRSDSLRRAVISLGCAEEKIRIQRTGIPLEAFAFQAREWPSDGRWQFVQASRLIEKKGLSTSLRAFAKFVRDHPHAHFTIAGDGPLRPMLEQQAQDLGIAAHVEFNGFLSQADLRDLFQRSHIFLHPSEIAGDGNQEGVPNSMLEAMASGLPVFATTHGGIPEVIDNGTSGFLVAEGDADALADKLVNAVRAPDRLSEIAARGAEVVAQNFGLTAQARKLEERYFEALRLK